MRTEVATLADVPPSTDELIYAWRRDGFAMHSMWSATVSRLSLQLSQLRRVTSNEADATSFAENYAGLPIGFSQDATGTRSGR